MPRPPCCRRIAGKPVVSMFSPVDGSACETAEVVLTLAEFEAIRLSDFDGLYQEKAAEHMNVSRATYGRVLESAHGKVARMLVSGLVLRIEGGPLCAGNWLESFCRSCAARLDAIPEGPVSCLSCRASGRLGENVVFCNRSQPCPGKPCWRLGGQMSPTLRTEASLDDAAVINETAKDMRYNACDDKCARSCQPQMHGPAENNSLTASAPLSKSASSGKSGKSNSVKKAVSGKKQTKNAGGGP